MAPTTPLVSIVTSRLVDLFVDFYKTFQVDVEKNNNHTENIAHPTNLYTPHLRKRLARTTTVGSAVDLYQLLIWADPYGWETES